MPLIDFVEEFSQCNKCGLCLASCPISKTLFLEKYSPRGKIQLARFYGQRKLVLSEQCKDIFSKCLLCGACAKACPSGLKLNEVLVGFREEIANQCGLHHQVEEVVRSLIENHNISAEDNEERAQWRELLGAIPEHGYEKDTAEVAYFVGCVASFFPMAQNIPKHFVRILDAGDVDFAILGGQEWCCGFPLIAAGAPQEGRKMIEHNLEKVKALGAKTIVFSCPSCYRTWKEYYDTELELLHSTQLIEKLISRRAIVLKEVNTTVTYHDPCDLGRNAGVFDAPRKILDAVPGLRLVEMKKNRVQSICCGGGGNLEMVDASLTGALALKKIEEIQQAGANKLVTACQQCVRTIKSRVRRQKIDLEVQDIIELVSEALTDPQLPTMY